MAVDVGKPPLFFRIEIEASRGLWRVCSGRITSRLIPPTHKHLPKLTPHKFFLRSTELVQTCLYPRCALTSFLKNYEDVFYVS